MKYIAMVPPPSPLEGVLPLMMDTTGMIRSRLVWLQPEGRATCACVMWCRGLKRLGQDLGDWKDGAGGACNGYGHGDMMVRMLQRFLVVSFGD